MTDLLAHLQESVRSRKLLPRGQSILVAVSGGLDSMVLLRLLHELSAKHNWKLTVAHFNHQLRGRSSDADERLVRTTAAALGLPIVVGQGNVRAFARQHGLSLEMAARELRHNFLARAAKRLGIRAVGLAHHADDQVEQFFLRLLRGAGGDGMAGMKWRAPSPAAVRIYATRRSKPGDPGSRLKAKLKTTLVRPLLDVSKADLEKFAREHKVRFGDDASNAALDIQRNRIRHELLPLLKTRYQSALARTVLRVMDIVGAEAEFVGEAARRWLGRGRRPAFQRLPVAVQRRCLQLQLLRLNLPADFEVIESLREFAGRPVSFSPAASVSRDDAGMVQVRAHLPVPFNPNERAVALEGRTSEVVFDGVRCQWRGGRAPSGPRPRPSGGCEFFDADRVGNRILLRHWRPGDRFQPIGMPASVKLQDWFTNRKIPRARRRELVLAATAAGDIFWVEGLRISDEFKLRPQTARRLIWRWRRL